MTALSELGVHAGPPASTVDVPGRSARRSGGSRARVRRGRGGRSGGPGETIHGGAGQARLERSKLAHSSRSLAGRLARGRSRLGLGLRLRVLREERRNVLVEIFHDEFLRPEWLEQFLRRVDRVAGDLDHDRRAVGLQRPAELLELVVLEAGIAQLRDEGSNRTAGDDPERPRPSWR
jgi:hypothetical protein